MSGKRENFYRRDPGKALAGMATMTLEERGVYNTIIDLLYLTWRPVEDNRTYIAAHCNCAVQKLNPIIRKLVEKGKLIQFAEDGQDYISNKHFEDERSSVKGVATPSGRGKVGGKSAGVEEKSPGVGEKSAGVDENPPSCANETKQIQIFTSLEKSREDKTRVEDAKASDPAPDGAAHEDPDPDPDKQAWALAKTVLTRQAGLTERQAGAFFGGLLKHHNLRPSEMLVPLMHAEDCGTLEPQPYLTQAAQNLKTPRLVHDRSSSDPKRTAFAEKLSDVSTAMQAAARGGGS